MEVQRFFVGYLGLCVVPWRLHGTAESIEFGDPLSIFVDEVTWPTIQVRNFSLIRIDPQIVVERGKYLLDVHRAVDR